MAGWSLWSLGLSPPGGEGRRRDLGLGEMVWSFKGLETFQTMSYGRRINSPDAAFTFSSQLQHTYIGKAMHSC